MPEMAVTVTPAVPGLGMYDKGQAKQPLCLVDSSDESASHLIDDRSIYKRWPQALSQPTVPHSHSISTRRCCRR